MVHIYRCHNGRSLRPPLPLRCSTNPPFKQPYTECIRSPPRSANPRLYISMCGLWNGHLAERIVRFCRPPPSPLLLPGPVKISIANNE